MNEIREKAIEAAGPVRSLRTRAAGYVALYHASNGVCRFALVAAHGALWAAWYLVCAKIAAMTFAVLDVTFRRSPRQKYTQFAAYITVIKEINRLVMVETFVLVHTILDGGAEAAIANGIPEDLARDYERLMQIPRDQRTEKKMQDLYKRHFRWEQQRVVSTKLTDAFEVFTWPLMSKLCQRPWVWFSYFKPGRSMNFKSFKDEEERVQKGMIAYERARSVGFEYLVRRTERHILFPRKQSLRG